MEEEKSNKTNFYKGWGLNRIGPAVLEATKLKFSQIRDLLLPKIAADAFKFFSDGVLSLIDIQQQPKQKWKNRASILGSGLQACENKPF